MIHGMDMGASSVLFRNALGWAAILVLSLVLNACSTAQPYYSESNRDPASEEQPVYSSYDEYADAEADEAATELPFFIYTPAPYHPQRENAPTEFFRDCNPHGQDHYSKSSYFCDWM